jgi:NADH-quinone oxidoreductase subunit A
VSGDGYFSTYALVGLVLAVGCAFVGVAFLGGRLLRPSAPTREKLLTYECGVDPVGEGWAQTHIRYYIYAYLYVIFAVDVMFLFPWATVFSAPGYGVTTLVEMFVFVGFLAVGLLYAWRKGVLTWT